MSKTNPTLSRDPMSISIAAAAVYYTFTPSPA
jgi:hypothetical protein